MYVGLNQTLEYDIGAGPVAFDKHEGGSLDLEGGEQQYNIGTGGQVGKPAGSQTGLGRRNGDLDFLVADVDQAQHARIAGDRSPDHRQDAGIKLEYPLGGVRVESGLGHPRAEQFDKGAGDHGRRRTVLPQQPEEPVLLEVPRQG